MNTFRLFCRFSRIWFLLIGHGLLVQAAAQADWQLILNQETSRSQVRSGSLFIPPPVRFDDRWESSLTVGGRLAVNLAENRIHVKIAVSERLVWTPRRRHQFALREAWAVVSLTDRIDLTAGRKILSWGTGYAFNPSGFVNPPKDPRDPSDRLDLRQGAELIQFDYILSDHAVNVVYSAPRLFFTRQPVAGRDQLAVRYNTRWRRLDISAMALLHAARSRKFGAAASYVPGQRVELHAELVLQRAGMGSLERLQLPDRGSGQPPRLLSLLSWLANPAGEALSPDRPLVLQALAGGTYTPAAGWLVVAEFYHDGLAWQRPENRAFYGRVACLAAAAATGTASGQSARLTLLQTAEQLPLANQGRHRLFFSCAKYGGHYSLQTIFLANLTDGSFCWVPQASWQPGRHWSLDLRGNWQLGKRRSEFGSSINGSIFTLGLRYNL